MKLIVAIVEPHIITDIKQALYDAQIYKWTVSNALGVGLDAGYKEVYRGIEQEIFLVKKVRIEIGVNEDFVELAIEAIIKAARGRSTNDSGDGKIFVLDLVDCIKIRTGERGSSAV